MISILLVDDDPLVLRIYQGKLSKLGARVETAVDGLAAIQALRARKPDVLVLDLMMPKLSGADVLKFIRSDATLKDLPVIVLSNYYMSDLAQVAVALGVQQALLFELIGKPAALSPSVLRTIASTVEFLGLLFDHALEGDVVAPLSAQALVVDNDRLNNRLLAAALQGAHFQVRTTDDPLVGLQWLKERRFDLVLLDLEMPGMDGFELCRRLRLFPGYQKTPVICVTSHGDFESRVRIVLDGPNELIVKPVLPLELAVKAVALLLRSQTKGGLS